MNQNHQGITSLTLLLILSNKLDAVSMADYVLITSLNTHRLNPVGLTND